MKTANKEKYFYSKIEDEVIVKAITDDFKSRQQNRRPYELSWELNMNFFYGNQYSYISKSGEICDIEKNYYWENREVYNHIAPVIESRIAKLNKIKPNIQVYSNSNSDKDIYTAKLTQSIIEHAIDSNNFSALLSELTYWSEITGTSFLKVSWDNSKGDIIGKINDDIVKNGDVNFSLCTPFEIYPDSNNMVNINDCNSIIHARAIPVKKINELYGTNLVGEDIDIFEIDNNSFISNIAGKSNFTKILHSKKPNHVLLIERYEKPTLSSPNGKYTIICQDKLLYDGDLPYKQGQNNSFVYPFIKQVSSKQIGSFWGVSVIERCIPIQRAYNSIKNKKHEYISRLASGVLLVEDGSVDIDNIEDEGLAPGKIIVYRNGAKEPTFLNPGTIPTELENEENRLLSELNNMCCVSDITTNSSIPGNINSGSALSMLISQDESRLSLTAENVKNTIIESGYFVLKLYKQFASNLRLTKLLDDNGNLEIFYWSNSDLKGDDTIISTENELEESINEKRSLILNLFDKGLLSNSDGKISYNNKIKILELFGLSNYNSFDDIDELHKNKAIKEMQNLKSLTEPLSVDNHQIHCNEHIKFLISDNAEKLTNEEQSKILNHIELHKNYLKETENGN